MDGWVRVLRPFNSISVISRWWKDEHERLCAMKRRLGLGRISPPATPWSEVGSDNRSATRTLRVWSGSTLFAQTCMSQYLGSLRYLLWVSPGLLLLLLLLYGHHLLSLGLRLLALHLRAKQNERKYCFQMIIISIKKKNRIWKESFSFSTDNTGNDKLIKVKHYLRLLTTKWYKPKAFCKAKINPATYWSLNLFTCSLYASKVKAS